MTEGEIKASVLQAKDQWGQIKICAQLNAVSEEDIKSILRTQGVDLRSLKGTNDKRRAGTIRRQMPHTASSNGTKPEIPAQVTIAEAMAAIRAELSEINRQQYQLDMRKADLYQQIRDILGEVDQ